MASLTAAQLTSQERSALQRELDELKHHLSLVETNFVFNLETGEVFVEDGYCVYCRSREHDENDCKRMSNAMDQYLAKAGAEISFGIPDLANPFSAAFFAAAAVTTGGLSSVISAAGMAKKAEGLANLAASERKEQAKHQLKYWQNFRKHEFEKGFETTPFARRIVKTNEGYLRKRIATVEKQLKN